MRKVLLAIRLVEMLPFKACGSILLALLLLSNYSIADVRPQTVLLLDQSDPNAPYGIEFRSNFRSILSTRTPPITVYVELADLGRFDSTEYENVLRDYLQGKYRNKPIGTLVANGSRMFQIGLRLRQELWPNIPLVFATVDQTTAEEQKIPDGVTGAIIPIRLRNAVDAARAIVPNLRTVFHVGDRWERQPFFSKLSQELPELTKEIEFVDLAGLSMTEIRTRAKSLPPDSAIVYTSLYVDGAGTSFAPINALSLVAEVANRPILVFSEVQIGHGATGGYVVRPGMVGEDAAKRVLRLLDGNNAADLPITMENFVQPIFDWRALQRFGIDERRLPKDSEIRFRSLTVWDQYRWQIIAIIAIVLAQALLISGLLIERRRRRLAQSEAQRHLLEVMHLNRGATVGAMSASIAHELNQPLAAIVSNGGAALRWLTRQPPDLDEARDAMRSTVTQGQRAGHIVENIRSMFKQTPQPRRLIDLNDVLRDVLALTRSEIQHHGVTLQTELSDDIPKALVDRVQLEQVALNLIMNALDAMDAIADRPRVLSIKSACDGAKAILITVGDTGVGIDQEHAQRIFESFFTTKSRGMGMGLSICRSIIESHGGSLSACPDDPHGTVFRVVVPIGSSAPPMTQLDRDGG